MVTEGRNNYSFNRSCLGGGDDAESLTTIQGGPAKVKPLTFLFLKFEWIDKIQ